MTDQKKKSSNRRRKSTVKSSAKPAVKPAAKPTAKSKAKGNGKPSKVVWVSPEPKVEEVTQAKVVENHELAPHVEPIKPIDKPEVRQESGFFSKIFSFFK